MREEAWALCLTFLEQLISLNTVNPPGNEHLAAQYIAKALSGFGIACEVQPVAPGRENVIATAPGEGQPVILTGHLDVVPEGEGWSVPPFALTKREDRLYGRGACDMKGGVAAMMAAAVCAHREGHARPFQLAFVADEEIYGEGTRAAIRSGKLMQDGYVIIGEPTDGGIHIAHRGVVRFRVTLRGRACHAGAPQLGVNALSGLAQLIRAVDAVNEDLQSVLHPVLPSATMCCTLAHAGTKDNIVPGVCEAVIDCRPVPGDTPQRLEALVRRKIDSLGGMDQSMEMTFEPYVDVRAGSMAENARIVTWAKRQYERCFGKSARVESFPACCDLSQFTQAGFETILYGPGSLKQAHTADEFVEAVQMEQALAFYKACLTAQ